MSNKVSQNHLDRISLLKRDAIDVASTLGELNYQKTILELQIEEQKKRIVELRKSESALFEELQQTYGKININLETGEYTVVE